MAPYSKINKFKCEHFDNLDNELFQFFQPLGFIIFVVLLQEDTFAHRESLQEVKQVVAEPENPRYLKVSILVFEAYQVGQTEVVPAHLGYVFQLFFTF